MSAVLAREHIAAVVDRVPAMADVDVDMWTSAVVAHLMPLPEYRPWRRRHWIGPSARRHAVLLERDQQHEDLPADPGVLVEHLTDEQQRDAARAAWRHLAALGLATPDPENDVVTRTLLGVA